MSGPLTVAILAGGLTHEREVSLHSGRRLAAVLSEAGMHVKVLDVDANLLQSLKSMQPDVVWPLIHGSTGEDGSLQGLLELVGVPYVGTSPAACRIASDKAVAGAVLSAAGLNVPDSVTIPQKLFREVGVGQVLDLVKARFDFPLVVKPAQGGSALGVTIVASAAGLPRAMVDCFAYDERARVEQYIEGTEVAVSVVQTGSEPRALPPVEIAADGPYDYDARYFAGRAEYFVPSRLSEEDTAAVKEAAKRAHSILGLRYLSRTDIILDDAGRAWILDVNVAPGMTETSLFPQAATAGALESETTVDDLYVEILNAALTDGR